MRIHAATGIALATLIGGCSTDLMVKKSNPTGSPGIAYALPKADISIEVTRKIVACGIGTDSKGNEYKRVSQIEPYFPIYDLQIETTAKIESRQLVDGSRTYVIDYEDSSNWLKTAEIAVEKYPGGSLKSVNTTLTDTTDKVIVGAVTLGAKVALMASGVPGVAGAMLPKSLELDAPDPAVPELCSDAVRGALAGLDDAAGRRKMLVNAKTAMEDDLARALIDQSILAPEIKRRSDAIKLRDAQIAAADRRIAALEAALKYTVTYAGLGDQGWRRDGSGNFVPSFAMNLPMEEAAIARWFMPAGLSCLEKYLSGTNGLPAACTPDARSTALPEQAQALVEFTHLGGAIASPDNVAHADSNGIVYREPVNVLLTVKQGTYGGKASPETVLQAKAAVPQLGALVYLPLHNGAFAVNSLKATFAENGALLSAGYSSAAQAEKALGALNQSLDVISKQQDAKRNAGLNEIRAETERLKAETALIEAQTENAKKLRDLSDARSK